MAAMSGAGPPMAIMTSLKAERSWIDIMRYRLQRKETIARPNTLGNRSFPVYTYHWRDIAVADDLAELEKLMPNDGKHRIEDTRKEIE